MTADGRWDAKVAVAAVVLTVTRALLELNPARMNSTGGSDGETLAEGLMDGEVDGDSLGEIDDD